MTDLLEDLEAAGMRAEIWMSPNTGRKLARVLGHSQPYKEADRIAGEHGAMWISAASSPRDLGYTMLLTQSGVKGDR